MFLLSFSGVQPGNNNDPVAGLQLFFHVNNGAGRLSVSWTPRYPGVLCDGRWHSVLANKNKYGLSLTVDGTMTQVDNPHPQSTSADTNDPIYVGGFPGNTLPPVVQCPDTLV